MHEIDRLLAYLAARRGGVLTRADCLAAGISAAIIDSRVRAGILIPVHDGVYRHAAVPFTQALRERAAVVAAGPDAVLSHRSAAARHRFPGVRRMKPEVTSPHRDLPRVDGVTLHRSLRLPASEIVTVDGVRVTTKGRTALDYCAVTPLAVAQEVIVEAVICKIINPQELVVTLERSGGRGCPGTAGLRMIAAGLEELEGIESMLELVIAGILATADLPPPVRQYPLTCADGRAVRLDFAWADRKVALDGDGRRWHGTPARRRRTAARRQSILDTGWIHLVYGWVDASDAPDVIRLEAETAYRSRLAEAA